MAVRGVIGNELNTRRIGFAFGLILICYLVLVARLLVLQGVEGRAIRSEAIRGRTDTIRIPAQRGTIVDRDGKPLAVSLYSGVVSFDSGMLAGRASSGASSAKVEREMADSNARTAAILGMDPGQLASMVQSARTQFAAGKRRFFVIRKDVSLTQAQMIRTARPRLLGFGLVDGTRRFYTARASAAQVVGFVNSDGRGEAGIERSCAVWLIGKTGYVRAEVDARRREIPETRGDTVVARDGLDIHTTLDEYAQQIATEEARKIVTAFKPAGVSIVILDPVNGDIIALVSMPDYDPNPGHSQTITPEAQWERCATRLYEPGSTLKAVTLSSALDEGVIGLDNRFVCTGHLQVGRKVIHCAHGEVHGSCDAEEILRHSCNIGAAQIGMKMGPARLYNADRKFGLLENFAIGMPGEKGGFLSLDSRENIYSEAKAARVAFGQSITTTPLHIAAAYGAIANGGVLMQPRLVSSATDSSGRTVFTREPKPIRRALSEKTSVEVCRMLRSVVTEGTGKMAAVPGYQVAGKTGTAQKYHLDKYVGSFVGFLPASRSARPRAVILVTVDEPQGKHYGADVAAPAFQAIAKQLMAYWHVQRDDPEALQATQAAANIRYGNDAAMHASFRD